MSVDHQVGVRRSALDDEVADEVGHHGLNCPDRDATTLPGMVAHFPCGILDIAKNTPGALEKGIPGLGRYSFAAKPVKQALSKLSLEIYNLLT
ncbi:MAG: hypothetical protein LW690_00480 [Opitutaceae bacterium]|jgi:hypothetical protein|nr:hypothetical protein [Opitutaceae bacterium]